MNENEASAWLEDTIWNNGYDVEWNSLVNAKNALAKELAPKLTFPLFAKFILLANFSLLL